MRLTRAIAAIALATAATNQPTNSLDLRYLRNVDGSPFDRIFDKAVSGQGTAAIQAALIVGGLEQAGGPGPHPDAVVVPTDIHIDLTASFPIAQQVADREV